MRVTGKCRRGGDISTIPKEAGTPGKSWSKIRAGKDSLKARGKVELPVHAKLALWDIQDYNVNTGR